MESCKERAGIEIRRSGAGKLSIRIGPDAGAADPSGWLLNYAADLEEAGCVIPNGGREPAQAISDVLQRNIEKAGGPAASDFADTGVEDLTTGFTLKVVEPIFRADAGPDPHTVEAGENASSLQASKDLAGMRTAWYSIQKELVYEKEEVNIFDHQALFPVAHGCARGRGCGSRGDPDWREDPA